MRYQQITLFDHPFLLDPDDSLELTKWGIYEKTESQLIRDALWDGAYFVDIGAHIGYYSALALSCGARVTAFEPNPLNAALLEINLHQYGRGGIGIHRIAVSDKQGYQQIYLSPINSGDDTLYPFDDLTRASFLVDTTKLDDLKFWDDPDFIKIDIQGGEIKALRGMEQTLARGHVSKIAVELFPDALRAAGDNPSEMLELLWKHGFKTWEIREGEGRLLEVNSVSICDRDDLKHGYTNLWCVRE